jgi:ADP-heptose:LPS heptosyltransferase
MLPVFLGKSEMTRRDLKSDYDYSRGYNLIDKTSLMEAAKIMKEAQVVLGIDNGLLHLASMTDATILYGFTMVGPEHRRISRPFGDTYELYGNKETLPCLFCQEKVRFFLGHNFKDCIYKEHTPACVRALNIESWVSTIEMALKDKNVTTN